MIVPDLIGQGNSEKLPASEGADRYGFDVAYDYLSGLLREISADQNVLLVIHDWGSALGFYWALTPTQGRFWLAGSGNSAAAGRTSRK